MIGQDNSVALTGIALTLTPGDPTAGWEIQRSPDGVSSWQTIAQLGPVSPGGGVYVDYLPLDGAARFYQVRQVKVGWQPSGWAAANPTSAIPTQLDLGTVSAALNYPATVIGVLLDTQAPTTKYVQRFDPNSYSDPDTVDGVQSYIDFPATTNFMRVGKAPKPIVASTNANPSVVTVTSHSLVTGDVVTIRGHLINTAINGTYPVTKIDDNTFSVPVAANGTGGATGHLVKLSLVIVGGLDSSSGDLSVYGTVQASTLIANGPGTFTSALRALGGSLARSLQHSVTGEYGDTTVNRVLLDGTNLYLMGDAGSGTNTEALRLGSYALAASPTARTTALFNSPAVGSKGWNDPDGIDDGINSISSNGNANNTIPTGSQLYVKLGVSSEGDFVDAYDDNYKISFRVKANYNSGANPTATVTSTVVVAYSTDSGTNWSDAPGSYVVIAGGTSSGYPANAAWTFNPTINIATPPNPTHVWFRLRLTLQANILDSTHHTGSCDGSVQCFSGNYKTSNYDTTWSTAASSLARRGLKIPATSNGTDNLPHALLDPLPAQTPSTNAAEGEVEYVGGSTHELYVRDQNQWVGLLKPRYIGASSTLGRGMTIIDTKSGLSTTSTVEASLGTISIPANTLIANGDCVRIRMRGRVIGGSFAIVAVTFGGTYVLGNAANYANNCGWWADIEIYRVGANTQKSWGVGYDNGTTPPGWAGGVNYREAREAEPAKTETAAITLDFRGKTGAGTLFMDSITVWCEAK